MKGNYTTKDFIKSDPIYHFFYKLYTAKKPDLKKTSNKKVLLWGLKYYTGAALIGMIPKYHNLITHATKYFPFSLFYQDRLIHYQNRDLRRLISMLEKISEKAGVEILLTNSNKSSQFYELYGHFFRKVDDVDKSLNLIEKAFQKEFETIYVRRFDDSRIKVLIPYEVLEDIINYKSLS